MHTYDMVKRWKGGMQEKYKLLCMSLVEYTNCYEYCNFNYMNVSHHGYVSTYTGKIPFSIGQCQNPFYINTFTFWQYY